MTTRGMEVQKGRPARRVRVAALDLDMVLA